MMIQIPLNRPAHTLFQPDLRPPIEQFHGFLSIGMVGKHIGFRERMLDNLGLFAGDLFHQRNQFADSDSFMPAQINNLISQGTKRLDRAAGNIIDISETA